MLSFQRKSAWDYLFPALFGLFLPVPFYLPILGGPVFPLQTFIIVVFLVLYFARHPSGPIVSVDRLMFWYFAWITLSFIVNIPYSILRAQGDLFANQSISYINALLLASPYLLTRAAFTARRQWYVYRQFFVASLAGIVLYYSVRYASNLHDLYLARGFIGQRVPLLLVFGAWAFCGPMYWKRWSSLSLWLWIMLTGIVALSLTRGAYLQWITTALVSTAYIYWTRREGTEKVEALKKLILMVGGLVVLAWVLFWLGPRIGLSSGSVVQRMEQILHAASTAQTDESVFVRLGIWGRLLALMGSSPIHLLVGYGQVGPSYLGGAFSGLRGGQIAMYSAHSQYLDTLVRSGIPGLVLETAVLGYAILRPLGRRSGFPRFYQAQSLALAGVLVYGLFAETLRWQLFGFVIFGYVGMVAAWERTHDSASASSRAARAKAGAVLRPTGSSKIGVR